LALLFLTSFPAGTFGTSIIVNEFEKMRNKHSGRKKKEKRGLTQL
jgi:hypothetical protein